MLVLIGLRAQRLLALGKTQEGCGGLRGEKPGEFPKAGPIFQQPFSLPENAQTLAGIAFRAAGKSVKFFPAASKCAGNLEQGISDSHSLLELSDFHGRSFSGMFLCNCWARFAISAAIYSLRCHMPDIENSRKTAEKGAEWLAVKQR